MRIREIEDKELRALALLRYNQRKSNAATLDSDVDGFDWRESEEGFDYWDDVDSGVRTTVNDKEQPPIYIRDEEYKVDVDKQRKETPIFSGVLMYFPDAIREVAQCSFIANEQHNEGEPMHWAKHKSNQHADCLARHLLEVGTVDEDGIRHATKVAWRALALLQIEIENGKKETV